MTASTVDAIKRAAEAIANADTLLITVGAGIGVDSGLPDFRGSEGFWRAYPALAKQGLRFEAMATPKLFHSDPKLAWGFYGHRLNLYRNTVPHRGFHILQEFCHGKSCCVFTSNVDGQFQKAGYDAERIVECHGSIHHLQCTDAKCGLSGTGKVWSAEDTTVVVDEVTLRARTPLPMCPDCGAVARPNIFMFGDMSWSDDRTHPQRKRFESWERSLQEQSIQGRSVIIECGADSRIATIRRHSEQFAGRHGATLIRINPREADGPQGTIALSSGALAALEAIAEAIAGQVR